VVLMSNEVVLMSIVIFVMLVVLSMAVKITAEYERAVIFRLGRFVAVKGPGLFLIIPFIDKMVNGIIKNKPGPFTATKRPNLNITARSYSAVILTAIERTTSITKITILIRITSFSSFFFKFYNFKLQPIYVYNNYFFSFLYSPTFRYRQP